MIVKKAFGGFEIEFEPFVANGNVMVNATEMAKIFGKKVEAFSRNETTQAFINECLKSENSSFLEAKARLISRAFIETNSNQII